MARVQDISAGVKLLKVVSWESIRKDRFSLTPQALFDDLTRNAQLILTSWRGDCTRRQERLRAPLEDDDEETAASREAIAEEGEGAKSKLFDVDCFGLDIDAEFRTKKFKGRFSNWEDVAKTSTEIVLDEMRTLLELLR